jgi:hypothetical protein
LQGEDLLLFNILLLLLLRCAVSLVGAAAFLLGVCGVASLPAAAFTDLAHELILM